MTQNNHQPLVAIAIVNWNRPLDTIECLESLDAITYKNHKTIVVDNGSDDGSPERIHAAAPGVEMLVNPSNLGFAAGINVGIVRALELGAAYVLLLNNDTVVDPGFLEPLVAVCEECRQISIVGPRVYCFGTRRLFSSGGWPRRFLPLLVRQVHPMAHEEDVPLGSPQEVVYVWGQAMLIRGEVFERIGVFDCGFFMYYEDCDFCLRALRAGFRVFYVPQSRIWHKVEHSTRGNEWMRWRYKIASMLRFHCKYARWGMVQAALQTTLTLLGVGLRELERGNRRWVIYPLAELWRKTLGMRRGSSIK